MPSTTFLNLSKVKQDKILDFALKEFSEFPFSEVSLNKIIKNAEISRGSFYTYFADKYDLLMYLLSIFKDKIISNTLSDIEVKKGSLKQLILTVHREIFSLFSEERNKKFLLNVISYFQSHIDEEAKGDRDQLPFLGDCEMLINFIDLSQFKFTDRVAINKTIDIGFAILKHTLFLTTTNKLNYEESKILLKEYLEILQFGYMVDENA
jgi:AcrR family transcriptional regulator